MKAKSALEHYKEELSGERKTHEDLEKTVGDVRGD